MFLAPKKARWILEDSTDYCHFKHVATPDAVVWNEDSLLEYINTASDIWYATRDLANIFCSVLIKIEDQK